ncbi:MAG: FAD-dependent oxidoreductase, partial [Pseudomonadota bacterium]
MKTGAAESEPGNKPIAVVGGGILGVATALYLVREGKAVVLVEREKLGAETSYGNAGVLASCSVVPVTTPGLLKSIPKYLLSKDSPLFLRWGYLPKLFPWLVRYLSHATAGHNRRIADALLPIVGDSLEQHQAMAKGTPAERWVVPSDYLFVYQHQQAFDADRFVWNIRQERGFHGEILEADALRAYAPGLGPANQLGVRVPGHGMIKDPGRYLADLAAVFQQMGGTIKKAEVTGFELEGDRVVGLQTSDGPLHCSQVVIAAGAWSAKLLGKLGIKISMESERGYHVEFYGANLDVPCPTMVAMGKFVATPMEGRLRCAGLVEFGGLSAQPSQGPFDLLMRKARETFPD